jgi:hypothetical protein
LFHAHHDGRCFLPIHVYEAITGKPVVVILRPGKTPDGAEVALVLRHVVRLIRAHWPKIDILVRGDSHYGRPEAMSWCEGDVTLTAPAHDEPEHRSFRPGHRGRRRCANERRRRAGEGKSRGRDVCRQEGRRGCGPPRKPR